MKLETNLLESAGQVSAQAGGKVGREERERQWELIRQIIKAEMRRHDDMSERALAEVAEIDQSSLNRFLRGASRKLTLDTLMGVADALGYDWTAFLALLRSGGCASG